MGPHGFSLCYQAFVLSGAFTYKFNAKDLEISLLYNQGFCVKAHFPIHDECHFVVCSGLTKEAWVKVLQHCVEPTLKKGWGNEITENPKGWAF